MPLNTLRLNHAPSSHPNDRIIFIKPLPRPPTQSADYETADTLLRAIAAQCLPIMKSHYLSVTTLEEHEPNTEFIGRNFNNGEIIQLVLRGKNGGWLPVHMIQMVMMHELAHNTHMNHGRQFWQARNLYAEEMRALWARGYTGEGFWGGGRTLTELGGRIGGSVVRSEELKDLSVCGGTFRSRRRKRKAKTQADGLSWREKRDRRIEKKFGKNGVALGEDEDKRLSLELQRKGPIGGKPRVAQSKRGRELRAAAALARFDTNKKEVEELDSVKREEEDTLSEDEYEDEDAGQEDARDTNGRPLVDSKGQNMIKVCEEEDQDDFHVKQEMEELEGLDLSSFDRTSLDNNKTKKNKSSSEPPKSLYDIPQHRDEPLIPNHQTPLPVTASSIMFDHFEDTSTQYPEHKYAPSKPSAPTPRPLVKVEPSLPEPAPAPAPSTTQLPSQPQASTTTTPKSTTACPICSLTNPTLNPTCTACGHVLDHRKDPRSWKCNSETCRESAYVNAGDVGVCGICGVRRTNT